jgi:peptidoglycan/LPS O-acetylase OafA/YrhL
MGNAALAIAATAVVVGLDYMASPWLRRCLSVPALVTVGVLSYGIYLWHGPMMRIAKGFGYSGAGWRAVVVLVSIVVASVSHRYAEVPIRSWARRRSDGGATRPSDLSRDAAKGVALSR